MHIAANIVHSDELLSAFLELEATPQKGFRTDNSLHQWPRLFVADHLDNIPRFIEHVDFSAPRNRRVVVRS